MDWESDSSDRLAFAARASADEERDRMVAEEDAEVFQRRDHWEPRGSGLDAEVDFEYQSGTLRRRRGRAGAPDLAAPHVLSTYVEQQHLAWCHEAQEHDASRSEDDDWERQADETREEVFEHAALTVVLPVALGLREQCPASEASTEPLAHPIAASRRPGRLRLRVAVGGRT